LSPSNSLPVPTEATPLTAWQEAPLVAPPFLPPGTSFAQFLTIVRAHWRQTVLIALALTLVIAVVLKMMPKTFAATATLMVNYEVSQDGKEFPIGAVGSYMATQVEFMESDRVLLPVIENLRLTADEQFTTGFSGNDAAVRRLWVLKNLRASLNITQGRGSQLLYVEASAREPRVAASIANEVVDIYLQEERWLANEPVSRRARDYAAQLAELQSKVTASQEKVTQFRRRNGLSDIAAHNDIELQSLNALEQQLVAVQNVRRAAEASSVGNLAVSAEVLASQTVQTLKDRLNEQQTELAQVSATLGPHHPRVRELQSRIAAIRGALQNEISVYARSNANQIASGRELEGALGRAAEQQRSKVLAVRQQQDEGAKLLLELESAQAVYKRALDGYDQIMFASAGKLTNVTLMSRATPAVRPAKPKKLKLMLAGMAAALFVGLLAPLTYEMAFDRRIRCRDDLERDFGMPVLAEFEGWTA
jgi:uncharacterized protein involved in exopolysaccharide biosynthesis